MEEERLSTILQDWQDLNTEKDVARYQQRLSHQYGASTAKLMAEALLFWHWLRDRAYGHSAVEYPFEGNRAYCYEVLLHFTKHENHYLALVAHWEMLPTSVMRKMLWHYNIDFPNYELPDGDFEAMHSFEAFLRRLTVEQKQAIYDNVNDLHQDQKLPRVLKKSWRAQVKNWWNIKVKKRNLVEELLNEPVNTDERYRTREAWVFNLLGLDFGFCKYPSGLFSDEKVEATSLASTFVQLKNFVASTKHHVNDFTVNQEFGKYWWFYRKARSNYVWRPNKTVELSSHICPGFWYTLVMHILFWIVCPVVFSAGVVNAIITDFDAVNMTPIVISGLLTPLWLTLATLKWLFMYLGSFITSNQNTLKNVLIVIMRVMGILICVAIVSIIEYGGFILLGRMLLTWFSYEATVTIVVFTSFLYLLFYLFLICSIIVKEFEIKESKFGKVVVDISDSSFAMKVFIGLVILTIIIIGLAIYVYLGSYIAFGAVWLFQNALIILPLLFIVYAGYHMIRVLIQWYTVKEFSYYEERERLLKWCSYGTIVAIVFLCVYVLGFKTVASTVLSIVIAIAVGLLIVAILSYLLVQFFKVEKTLTEDYREAIYQITDWHQFGARRRLIKKEDLFNNSWLMSNGNRIKILNEIMEITDGFLHYDEVYERLYHTIFMFLTEGSYNHLVKGIGSLKKMDDKEKIWAVQSLMTRFDYDPLLFVQERTKMLQKQRDQESARKARTRQFFYRLSIPFRFVLMPIGIFFERVWGWFTDLYVLAYEVFKRSCPYVNKSRTLN